MIWSFLFLKIIEISESNEYKIDLLSDPEVLLNINVENLGIAFHNIFGYNCSIFDENGILYDLFDQNTEIPYIDFGGKLGSILIKKESLYSGFLTFSTIVFPIICTKKVISIGNNFNFIVGSMNSNYPYTNLTYDVYQDYCFWFSSPVQMYYYLNINVEATYDYLSYQYFDGKTLSKINEVSLYSGSFISNGSVLFEWHSDMSVVTQGLTIFGENISSVGNEKSIYSVGFSYLSSSLIHIPDYYLTDYTTIYVENILDLKINLNDNKLLIIFLYENSSIVFHNRTGFMANFYSMNGDYIDRINESTVNKVFSFFNSIGYCLVEKASLSPFSIDLSTIVLSKIDVMCEKFFFSSGVSHKFHLTQSLFGGFRNYTLENDFSCLWISSPLDLSHNLELVHNTQSFFKIYSSSSNETIYNSKKVLISKSIFVHWNLFGSNSDNYFFNLNSFTNIVEKGYENFGIQFKINEFGDSIPLMNIINFIINDTKDYSIPLNYVEKIILFIPNPKTYISIHSKENFQVKIFDNSYTLNENINNSNGNSLISFDSRNGYVEIIKTGPISNFYFSTLYMYNNYLSEKCSSLKYFASGILNDIYIQSNHFAYFNYRSLTFVQNLSVCIWIASPIKLYYEIYYNLDLGNDFFEIYNENHTEGNPKIISGIGNYFYSSSQSQVMYLRTDENSFQGYLSLNYLSYEVLNIDEFNFFETSQYNFPDGTLQNYLYEDLVEYYSTELYFSIEKSGDYYIELDSFKYIQIYVPFPKSLIFFNSLEGFTIEIPRFEINNMTKKRFLQDNKIIYFDNTPNVLLINITSPNIEYIDFSILISIEEEYGCIEDKYISDGNNTFILNSTHIMQTKVTKFENQTFCLWYPSGTKSIQYNFNFSEGTFFNLYSPSESKNYKLENNFSDYFQGKYNAWDSILIKIFNFQFKNDTFIIINSSRSNIEESQNKIKIFKFKDQSVYNDYTEYVIWLVIFCFVLYILINICFQSGLKERFYSIFFDNNNEEEDKNSMNSQSVKESSDTLE